MKQIVFRLLGTVIIYSIWYTILIGSIIAISVISIAWTAKDKITEWRTQSIGETNTIK